MLLSLDQPESKRKLFSLCHYIIFFFRKKEKQEKKGAKDQTRQKSQIHRQQWFKNKVDGKKKGTVGAKKKGANKRK